MLGIVQFVNTGHQLAGGNSSLLVSRIGVPDHAPGRQLAFDKDACSPRDHDEHRQYPSRRGVHVSKHQPADCSHVERTPSEQQESKQYPSRPDQQREERNLPTEPAEPAFECEVQLMEKDGAGGSDDELDVAADQPAALLPTQSPDHDERQIRMHPQDVISLYLAHLPIVRSQRHQAIVRVNHLCDGKNALGTARQVCKHNMHALSNYL